jgi:hypothetical protein
MPHLELSDDEAALIKELHNTVHNDCYPFAERIRTLKAMLAKLRPEPVRDPLQPPKVYTPLRATAAGGPLEPKGRCRAERFSKGQNAWLMKKRPLIGTRL